MLSQPWQNFAASFFTILLLGSPTFFIGKSQADKPTNSSANLVPKNRGPNGPETKKSDPRQIAALAADRKAEAERQPPLSNVKEPSQTKKDISAIKLDKKFNPSKNEISANHPQQKYTYEKYNQIINGLDYTQVKAILGDDGEEISRKNLGLDQAFVFEWKNSDSSVIIIKMINYVVVEKTQSGLKKASN